MYKEQIEKYIEDHKVEMIEDIKKLMCINSERGEALEGKPYGEGAAECLKVAKEMIASYGFDTKNYDNYVITADLNDKEKQLDILAHLDVVPAGDDWTVTKPYEPLVVDGRIYGRGSSDDKGPAVAALYAMRAVKELDLPVNKNVRLILGSDEECGSSDIEHYYNIEKEAPMTFSPDAEFPVINIEKGGLQSGFEVQFKECEKLPRILKIKGGDKINVVPGKAYALVEGLNRNVIEEIAKEVSAVTKVVYDVEVEDENKKIVKINSKGVPCHASTPELGNNAITGLLQLLVKLPIEDSVGFEKVKSINSLFDHNDYDGISLGVNMEDELSGKLTICLSIIDFDLTKFTGSFDCRAPLCATNENLRDVIKEKMDKANIKLNDNDVYEGHHVDGESDFVKTLLSCYETYSGRAGKAIAIGGGTYVHHLNNGVAFGCADLDLDNHMHGADEFAEIDALVMSAKIFAEAIVRLCK